MVLNVSQGHSLVRRTLGLQDEARLSTGKRVMGIGTRLKFKVLGGPWKEGQNQVTMVIRDPGWWVRETDSCRVKANGHMLLETGHWQDVATPILPTPFYRFHFTVALAMEDNLAPVQFSNKTKICLILTSDFCLLGFIFSQKDKYTLKHISANPSSFLYFVCPMIGL